MRKVAAKAMIAYNSGKTARIIVFPNTSLPEPIAAIPLDVTLPCLMAENNPTNPNASPADSMATPCHNSSRSTPSVMNSCILPLTTKNPANPYKP